MIGQTLTGKPDYISESLLAAAEYAEKAARASDAARRLRALAREYVDDPDLSELLDTVAVDSEELALHYRNQAVL